MRQTGKCEIGSMGMSTATLNMAVAIGASGRPALQVGVTCGVGSEGRNTMGAA